MFKLAPEKDKNTKEKNYISKTKIERKWRISVLQIKFENPWQELWRELHYRHAGQYLE